MATTNKSIDPVYQEISTFRTVNTAASPVTMKDDELDILLNLMPLGTSLWTVAGASNSLCAIGSSEAAWQANHTYATNSIVRPTVANGFIYMVTAGGGGNSGGSEPAWPTTNGSTKTDGSLTWTAYDCTIKRMFVVNISGTLYHLVFCTGGMIYRVDASYNQFRLCLPAVFTNPRFDQWKSSGAVFVDPTAGYYSYMGTGAAFTAAGTAIATTNTKVKTTNSITFYIGTTAYTKAATDNLWTLTGFNATNGYYNKCYLYVNSSGTASIASGTQSLTLSGVVMPTIDPTKSLLGVLTVRPTGTGNFTGGTTALNDGTVIPNAAFTDATLLQLISSSTVGTCIASWQGRVWIGNNRTIIFTAPDAYDDLNVADGAGAVIDNYPDMRNSISNFASTQNYLYVICDHATHIIYGLQILNQANTSFQLIDILPQIGTPYPDAIQVMGDLVLIFGDSGTHVVNAGSFKNVSDMLDGIYPLIDTTFLPVSFLAKIYNKIVFCTIVSVYSPIDGNKQKWLFCFYENRWFFVLMGTSASWLDLNYCEQKISTLDIQCYGAYGNNIVQLFTGTNTMWKKVRTKAFDFGKKSFDKQVLKVGGTISTTIGLSASLSVTITSIGTGSPDVNGNASGLTNPPMQYVATSLPWYNNSSVLVSWINNSSATVTWTLPYNEISNYQTCDGRGKRIQLDWSEISNNQYEISSLGLEVQLGAPY